MTSEPIMKPEILIPILCQRNGQLWTDIAGKVSLPWQEAEICFL